MSRGSSAMIHNIKVPSHLDTTESDFDDDI